MSRVSLIHIDEASSRCEFTLIRPLIEARYGHCQTYINGIVYIMGGFDHEDIVGLPPSTLSSCEIYAPPDSDSSGG